MKISASILSADFANLALEIQAIEKAGADFVHVDVMDGHFVPNITFGTHVISKIKPHTQLTFDVHLMITNPENSVLDYITSGADYITIHPETTTHLDRTIDLIKNGGAKVGIALLPTTQVNILEYILDKIDLILIMCVNPGFGGQSFIESQLLKIEKITKMVGNRNILISVDGGINPRTAKLCKEYGANMLVSGNYIFHGDCGQNIKNLKNAAR